MGAGTVFSGLLRNVQAHVKRKARNDAGLMGSFGRVRNGLEVSLFSDAETGENPPEKVIGSKLAGYLSKFLLRLEEIFGN